MPLGNCERLVSLELPEQFLVLKLCVSLCLMTRANKSAVLAKSLQTIVLFESDMITEGCRSLQSLYAVRIVGTSSIGSVRNASVCSLFHVCWLVVDFEQSSHSPELRSILDLRGRFCE